MTTPYATAEELRAQTNKVSEDDDLVLEFLLEAATECIDGITNRLDGWVADATASARLYRGDGSFYQWIDPCISVTKVEVKVSPTDDTYEEWETTDWLPFSGSYKRPNFNRLPYSGVMSSGTGSLLYFTSGIVHGRPGFTPDKEGDRGVPTVRVTGRWGMTAVVPSVVKSATILQASRWYKRAQSSWGDTLANVDMGQLMFTKQLDPDFEAMIRRARKVRPTIGIR